MHHSLHPIHDDEPERAYLVGIGIKGGKPLLSVEESLRELSELAHTAGLEVVGATKQMVEEVHPKMFVGTGKAEEIKNTIEEIGAELVIFDDELTPRHQRELEKFFGENIKVLDRSALIIDIFGQHAQTHEGRLQVSLAQYEYLLPRLTRQWTHLERQAGGGSARGGTGGVGLRGPGETQLEVDRRDIGRRISKLKEELEGVRAHRLRHRQQRHKTGIPVVSLVGYTNAGKSTLMKRLTEADVYIADQLFATLDPTTRKARLPSGKELLFSDTVGFIQKLPTTLIAAFRATLEEIHESDMLLHVVDSAHPYALQHIEAVEDTLAELDIPRLPMILVLNKCDLWREETALDRFQSLAYSQVVKVSARTGTGLEALREAIDHTLRQNMVKVSLALPYRHGDLIAEVHRQGMVESEEHTGEGVVLSAYLPPRFAEFLSQHALISKK